MVSFGEGPLLARISPVTTQVTRAPHPSLILPGSAPVWYVPAPPLSDTEPPAFVPSILNGTAPVGVPCPGATAFKEKVNVTDWLGTDGLTDELKLATLAAFVIVSVPATYAKL